MHFDNPIVAPSAPAANLDDDRVSLWGIRLLMTIVERGGRMRIDWERCPPSFRNQIGDLHQRGILVAREELESRLQVSGDVYLIRTDKTGKILDAYNQAVQQGRVMKLTPFGDDVSRIIRA